MNSADRNGAENEAEGSGEGAVSIADALEMANDLHRRGDLDQATTLYRRILDASPNWPPALHFLGMALHHQGQSEDGVALILESVRLAPAEAGWHNNLGNVFLEMGRYDEAVGAYRESARLVPKNASVLNNLAILFKALGEPEEAEAAYRRAIEIDPDHALAHRNYGLLLSERGEVRAALEHYFKAITLEPQEGETKKLLGIAYYALGDKGKAAEVFKDWMRVEPENPTPRHLYAACSGHDVPSRAPDDYVQHTFDNFAQTFDEKLAKLEYRAPQLIADALREALGPAAGKLRILDAGCGTGLCGPLLAPIAGELVGVDLSAGMLNKAAARDVYTKLWRAELTEFIEAQPDGRYDVIVSADTLCYFGDLGPPVRASHRALASGGWLAVTLERSTTADPAPDYEIQPNGRYSHRTAYVQRLLESFGFARILTSAAQLRMEAGLPVEGIVLLAQKPG